MTVQSRIGIAVAFVLLLALFLGARRVGRELAAPFEGFDRLATARPAVVAKEPPEAGFEIDVPLVEVEPSRGSDDAPPIENRVARAGGGTPPRSTNDLHVEKTRLRLAQPLASQLANYRVEMTISLWSELDVESLASPLNLSDSQKARLSNLIEWRKTMLDALAGIEGSEESAKAVIESFRTALEAELDPAQAQAYQKMKEPGAGVDLLRTLASEALNQAKTRTSPLVIQELLKAQARE